MAELDANMNKETNKAYKIIIAGGGTGGHIFPALAIANAIKKFAPQTDILFVGAKGKMEMEKIPQAGYPIKGLVIAGFNRSSLIKNILLPFKLLYSFIQVVRIINNFRPSAVIGVGGYSSFPVLSYAQVKGIPSFLHESNSFAGKSNKLLGKKATKVFTATDGMEKFFPADKIIISGNPVRREIISGNVSKEEAMNFFGLRADKKTVLVIGGSLGAGNINEAIAGHLDEFSKNNLQLIWQTGKPYLNRALEKSSNQESIYVSDFIRQMEYAYVAADIVISRSGAMTIAELCLVKKPVVFVPYPFATEDHQTVNAKKLVEKHAALMIKDSEARDELVRMIIQLSREPSLQQELKINIGKLGIVDADEIIAKEILRSIK